MEALPSPATTLFPVAGTAACSHVSSGYATALLDAARCSGAFDTIEADARRVLRDLRRGEAAARLVKGGRVHHHVAVLVRMLERKGKAELVEEVMEEVGRLCGEMRGEKAVESPVKMKAASEKLGMMKGRSAGTTGKLARSHGGATAKISEGAAKASSYLEGVVCNCNLPAKLMMADVPARSRLRDRMFYVCSKLTGDREGEPCLFRRLASTLEPTEKRTREQFKFLTNLFLSIDDEVKLLRDATTVGVIQDAEPWNHGVECSCKRRAALVIDASKSMQNPTERLFFECPTNGPKVDAARCSFRQPAMMKKPARVDYVEEQKLRAIIFLLLHKYAELERELDKATERKKDSDFWVTMLSELCRRNYDKKVKFYELQKKLDEITDLL